MELGKFDKYKLKSKLKFRPLYPGQKITKSPYFKNWKNEKSTIECRYCGGHTKEKSNTIYCNCGAEICAACYRILNIKGSKKQEQLINDNDFEYNNKIHNCIWVLIEISRDYASDVEYTNWQLFVIIIRYLFLSSFTLTSKFYENFSKDFKLNNSLTKILLYPVCVLYFIYNIHFLVKILLIPLFIPGSFIEHFNTALMYNYVYLEKSQLSEWPFIGYMVVF